MEGKYYDLFENRDSVVSNYGDHTPPEANIIYAGYSYEDYSGAALVVFTKDGKLYESNDYHCSCNGLEDWSPEETTVDALMIRNGWPGMREAVKAYAEAQIG